MDESQASGMGEYSKGGTPIHGGNPASHSDCARADETIGVGTVGQAGLDFAASVGHADGTGFISRVSGVRVSPPLVEVQPSPHATVTREPAEEYHRSPGVSCSMLKDYAESPLGFYLRHVAKVAPAKSSAALRTGALLHLRHELATTEAWKQAVAIAPDSVTTAAGQLAKSAAKWLEELPPGVLGITADEERTASAIYEGVLRNSAARELIEARVDAEFNVRWQWDSMLMRCRCDGATDYGWYDLKTTSDRDIPRDFKHSVRKWGYDLQSAVYGEAAEAAGWEPHRLTFIVVSTVWPHLCHVVRLPSAVIERARFRAMRYLREIRDRLEWGDWLPDDYGQVLDLDMGNYWRD